MSVPDLGKECKVRITDGCVGNRSPQVHLTASLTLCPDGNKYGVVLLMFLSVTCRLCPASIELHVKCSRQFPNRVAKGDMHLTV